MRNSLLSRRAILARRLSGAFLSGLLVSYVVVFILSCVASPEIGDSNAAGSTASPMPISTVHPARLVTPGNRDDPDDAAPPVPTGSTAPSTSEATLRYSYRIVNVYPHDQEAFTQGLVLEEGVLYEGTGLWAHSTLRKVDLETGDITQIYTLPVQYFGEGITVYGENIIQLTWKAETGFVYDRDSFELSETFTYTTEGWGITHDGTQLIMSDGTSWLHFWDVETFEEIGQIQVHDGNGPVTMLNELEYIKGQVYANVWQTDLIAIIDPQTGQVSGWLDLTGLLDPQDYYGRVDVLNGIAYDAENDRLFVTGKLWPRLFEIDMVFHTFLPLPDK